MHSKKVDLIIVGQGLAGSILALQALSQNKTILVFENMHKNTASYAAIGMHNPLIIKKQRKTWRAKELTEYALNFYHRSAHFLGKDFRKDMQIYRPFSNKAEEIQWVEKTYLDAWQDFICVKEQTFLGQHRTVGKVKMSGWLDVKQFIAQTKIELEKRALYKSKKFEYEKLKIEPGGVQYEGLSSDHIIFAEGYRMKENPFFKHLPMKEVKGEILVVEDKNLKIDYAIKGPYYIVPIGKDQYKVGATFEWDNFNEKVSSDARETMLKEISPFLSEDFTVIDQLGGVRPTVSDRRPLIGTHDKYKNVHVFNGLGTRGVTLGPFFSFQLLDKIFGNGPLDFEVDIARFN